jgi:hypothetical protein
MHNGRGVEFERRRRLCEDVEKKMNKIKMSQIIHLELRYISIRYDLLLKIHPEKSHVIHEKM